MRYVVAALAAFALLAIWHNFWAAFSDAGDMIMIALLFTAPALIVKHGKRDPGSQPAGAPPRPGS